MSDMAAKEGFHKTLLLYADDSVIKPNEGVLPVIGKTALQNAWSNKKDDSVITWQPFKAEASQSGDLGYSIGNWKYETKDTTMYGNYFTIWKRQSDGKWKFVFDGGNNTPKP
jgi:ketosteroid isomerase-like protein